MPGYGPRAPDRPRIGMVRAFVVAMSRAVGGLSMRTVAFSRFLPGFVELLCKPSVLANDHDKTCQVARMNHSKRHRAILTLLQQAGTVTISDLARQLDVSLETIRRDIKPLTSEGMIVKMHGAISLPSMTSEAPFEKRMRENSEAKKAIAMAMAATVRDGDSIMLDTGTTTSFLARELLGHRRLTVITNSSDIARTLSTVNDNRVYMAGGELRSDNGAAFGVSAIEFVSRFSVTHSVISAGAVDAVSGIMDFDLDEAEFARMVISRGRRSVAVTDHTKFGRQGLVKVCGFSELTELITDQVPPPTIMEALASASVQVMPASPSGD